MLSAHVCYDPDAKAVIWGGEEKAEAIGSRGKRKQLGGSEGRDVL